MLIMTFELVRYSYPAEFADTAFEYNEPPRSKLRGI